MEVIEGLADDESYLLAILSDTSGLDQAEFCVAGGQLVLTGDGWIPIEKVAVGQRVLTHRGRWRRVSAVHDRGVQEVVVVKGQGHPGLKVTADHELLVRTVRRGSLPDDGHRGRVLAAPTWLAAATVPLVGYNGRGAYWATPVTVEALPTPESPTKRGNSRENLIACWTDPSWMWLFGFYLAEGSVNTADQAGWSVSWATNTAKVSAVTSRLEKLGLPYNCRPTRSEYCLNIVVYGHQLVHWLVQHGGRRAENKTVPAWLYGLPAHLRREVLDGYLAGDGTPCARGGQAASTVSRSLAWGIRLLAATLGFGASVSYIPEHTSSFGTRARPAWRMTFDRGDGTSPRVHFDGTHAWSAIKSVRPGGTSHVWDLSVEDDHSFLVEGVVVHNCWHESDLTVSPDGCWRAWPFQWKWFRAAEPLQIDQCSRSVGKTTSITLRMFAFPFLFPGQEAVITAPELVHLEPLTNLIERKFDDCRLGREMLPHGRSAVTHRPFMMNFVNGARIIGRIPQRDGRGVKGIHAIWLELDEAQDYPEPGWTELVETLKRGHEGSVWRAHGVTRGVRDKFYEFTQGDSTMSRWQNGWTLRPSQPDSHLPAPAPGRTSKTTPCESILKR